MGLSKLANVSWGSRVMTSRSSFGPRLVVDLLDLGFALWVIFTSMID